TSSAVKECSAMFALGAPTGCTGWASVAQRARWAAYPIGDRVGTGRRFDPPVRGVAAGPPLPDTGRGTNRPQRRGYEMKDNEDMDLASGIAAFEAKHFSQAFKLLSPLADAGNAEALYRLAIMHQNGLGVVRNELKAFGSMKRAAEAGHALAQHGLGFMYMDGDCIDRDGARAVKWFTRAAEQGLAGSKATLAMMYQEGTLVEKDEALAARLLKEAGF